MTREVRTLVKSFRCAFRGAALGVRFERNFRIHLCAAAYVSLFAWLGELSGSEMALLIVCFGLMLSSELLNTAIERLCDAAAPEYNPMIGAVKDVAAGAVLVSALTCALVGLFLFFSDGAFFRALERLAHTPALLAGTLVSLVPALFFIFHKHK